MADQEKWSSASLRIRSSSITAREITIKLGIIPTRSCEKGTPLSKRHPSGPKRQECLWVLDSGLDDLQALESHIKVLISVLERKREILQELSKVCDIDFFCGFSFKTGQGSIVLEASLLRKLAEYPVDIVFDLYGSYEDNEEERRQD